ncbi:F17d-G fimbrial adhesin precursor [compost metagenome]
MKARVRFVATGPLSPGIYNIPGRAILNVDQTVFNGQAVFATRTQTLSYQGATVTVTDATCAVLPADRNLQVALPAVLSSRFQGIGSTLGLQRFTIRVNCTAGVALHATMTDANSQANTSNILTLAQDSTATGVGLQISATDRAHVVSYGADSRVAGNNNQWFVGGNAASPQTNHIIPFTVRYVQTAAAVQPGTVRARSTITFSYQ